MVILCQGNLEFINAKLLISGMGVSGALSAYGLKILNVWNNHYRESQ